jgi:hypothetical protein
LLFTLFKQAILTIVDNPQTPGLLVTGELIPVIPYNMLEPVGVVVGVLVNIGQQDLRRKPFPIAHLIAMGLWYPIEPANVNMIQLILNEPIWQLYPVGKGKQMGQLAVETHLLNQPMMDNRLHLRVLGQVAATGISP